MLAVMLFVAPGEPGDSGEPAQPAFLNFDIALLVEPAGGLQVGHPGPLGTLACPSLVAASEFKMGALRPACAPCTQHWAPRTPRSTGARARRGC